MTQLDYNGNGGLLQARLLGRKVTSKQLPLGFAELPADFINAYVLGNLGTTGTQVAACATFLYNLRQGIRDIQSGSHKVVIVGTSEAPITPEVIEGYAAMGALASDAALQALDGRKMDNHVLLVRSVRDRQLGGCHIALIGDAPGLPVAPAATLLVSESPGMLERGAMLNLQVEDGRVVFDVGLEAARRAGLDISAKLLRLARFVKKS